MERAVQGREVGQYDIMGFDVPGGKFASGSDLVGLKVFLVLKQPGHTL